VHWRFTLFESLIFSVSKKFSLSLIKPMIYSRSRILERVWVSIICISQISIQALLTLSYGAWDYSTSYMDFFPFIITDIIGIFYISSYFNCLHNVYNSRHSSLNNFCVISLSPPLRCLDNFSPPLKCATLLFMKIFLP